MADPIGIKGSDSLLKVACPIFSLFFLFLFLLTFRDFEKKAHIFSLPHEKLNSWNVFCSGDIGENMANFGKQIHGKVRNISRQKFLRTSN